MRSWVGFGVLLVAAACGADEDSPLPTHEGPAKILAWQQSGPGAIAASEHGLFWLAGGGVVGLASPDAVPVELAALPNQQPVELCVTPSELYVVTFGAGAVLGPITIFGGVFRAALDGSASVQEIYRPDTFGPSDVACDGAGLFWMQIWTTLTTKGGLIGLDGDGHPTQLAPGGLTGHDVALDASFIYWTVDGMHLMRAPRSLPLVGETIAVSPGYARHIEVSGTELLWIVPPMNSGQPATLLAAPVTGGSPRVVANVVDQSTLHYSLAADDTHVYWTEFRPGRIMRVARGGGAPEVFADGQGGPADIVLRGNAAYWTNSSTGTVVTLPITAP